MDARDFNGDGHPDYALYNPDQRGKQPYGISITTFMSSALSVQLFRPAGASGA